MVYANGGARVGTAALVTRRSPLDVKVNPTPPPAKPLTRPVGKSAAQDAEVQRDIAAAKAAGGSDFRVNQ